MTRIYGLIMLMIMSIGSVLGVKRYVEQNALRKAELKNRDHKDKQRKDMTDAEIDDLISADDFIAKRLRDANKRKR